MLFDLVRMLAPGVPSSRLFDSGNGGRVPMLKELTLLPFSLRNPSKPLLAWSVLHEFSPGSWAMIHQVPWFRFALHISCEIKWSSA